MLPPASPKSCEGKAITRRDTITNGRCSGMKQPKTVKRKSTKDTGKILQLRVAALPDGVVMTEAMVQLVVVMCHEIWGDCTPEHFEEWFRAHHALEQRGLIRWLCDERGVIGGYQMARTEEEAKRWQALQDVVAVERP
jgi:hypothetical protein